MKRAAEGGDTTMLRNILEKNPNYSTVRFPYTYVFDDKYISQVG